MLFCGYIDIFLKNGYNIGRKYLKDGDKEKNKLDKQGLWEFYRIENCSDRSRRF